MNSQQRVYEFGPFRIDTMKRVLWRDGEQVQLTSKSLDTLLVLVERRGEVVSKDDLMKALWPDTVVEENNLTQQISMLRKVLGEKVGEHRYLVTVPGRGYLFVADVNVPGNTDMNLILKQPGSSRIPVDLEQNGGKLLGASSIELDRAPVQRLIARSTLRTRVVLFACLIVTALMLAAYGLSWRRARLTGDREPNRSIAVLPFKPINSDATSAYLGTGMADALIARLSNLKQISVRPTSAIFKYAEQQPDPQTVGRELGVDAVLEGTVQKLAGRVRVTVQLVDARSGSPIWAQTFDQEMIDIFAVQDAISQEVAQAMMVKLNVEDQKQLRKRSTENLAAYQEYLAGRYFWNTRNKEGLTKSLTHFQRAIELDANYAQAYTGLADAYIILVAHKICSEPEIEAVQKARSAAIKAIAIDGNLAEAHASLAMIKTRYDHDESGAEDEYQRAIELNPDYATAHHWYSEHLAIVGREQEALTEIRTAQVLDPLSAVINTTLGERLFYARRYDEAIAQLRRTIDISPNFASAHYVLGLVLEQKGMFDEAISEFQKFRVASAMEHAADASLGHSYALAGRQNDARKILHHMLSVKDSEPFEIALVYQGLGDKQQVLSWLERIEDTNCEFGMMLRLDPRLDNLRSEPRFQKLIQRHNSSGAVARLSRRAG